MSNKAVFLDRDGTLIVDKNYLKLPKDVVLMNRIVPALRMLQEKGYLLIVVSNQSGIGRGFFTITDHLAVEKHLEGLFANMDIHIKKSYYCPHTPDDNCDCRKPKPSLLENAIKEFGIDPKKSFMIGDKLSDVGAGHNAGVKSVLVRSAKKETGTEVADYVAEDVYDAVMNFILP